MPKFITKSLIINIVLIIIAVVASYRTARMVHSVLVVQKEASENREKIEELKKKKQELEQYLTELQTKEAIEREAKERLNLKKFGEQVVVIVPEKSEIPMAASSKSFWRYITSFFQR